VTQTVLAADAGAGTTFSTQQARDIMQTIVPTRRDDVRAALVHVLQTLEVAGRPWHERSAADVLLFVAQNGVRDAVIGDASHCAIAKYIARAMDTLGEPIRIVSTTRQSVVVYYEPRDMFDAFSHVYIETPLWLADAIQLFDEGFGPAPLYRIEPQDDVEYVA
jgi:hypothetical protein